MQLDDGREFGGVFVHICVEGVPGSWDYYFGLLVVFESLRIFLFALKPCLLIGLCDDFVSSTSFRYRYQTGDRLQVHISDADAKRYEVPQQLLPREGVDHLETEEGAPCGLRKALGLRPPMPKSGSLTNSKYQLEFKYESEPFGFAIVRRSNGEVLFNTSATDAPNPFNNLVFKDQYLEISSHLPYKSAMYGLGESSRPDGLRLAHGRQYTMWATDIGSWNIDIDLYGTYPFLMDMRDGGLAHGVALMNSNGMDIYYGDDFITFKAIGGIFDFYFFAGSTPLKVVDQYTQLVGRPASMPYWVLGTTSSPPYLTIL